MKTFYFVFFSFFIVGCAESYTPDEIAEAYCKCSELPKVNKLSCINEWSQKFAGVLKTEEDQRQVNYNMIECNGFEGDNDFYLKLMQN